MKILPKIGLIKITYQHRAKDVNDAKALHITDCRCENWSNKNEIRIYHMEKWENIF